MRHVVGVRRRRLQVQKTPFLNHFCAILYSKTDHFQDRLGQTSG